MSGVPEQDPGKPSRAMWGRSMSTDRRALSAVKRSPGRDGTFLGFAENEVSF